jgi:hypothetical protein
MKIVQVRRPVTPLRERSYTEYNGMSVGIALIGGKFSLRGTASKPGTCIA